MRSRTRTNLLPQDEKAQKDKSAKQEDKNAKQQDKNNEKKARSSKIRTNKQEKSNAQQHQGEKNKQQGSPLPIRWLFVRILGRAPSNWLYTQDVFVVVEIDGVYYLCNAMYPGVNITLSIAE
jgi:hypothetical protein